MEVIIKMKDKKIFWIIGIILLLMFTLCSVDKKEAGATISRGLSKSTVSPAGTFTLTYSSNSGATYIQDTIGSGFTLATADDLVNIQNGVLTTFFMGNSKSISLKAPSTEGSYSFSGTYTDIDDDQGTINGVSSITVGTSTTCTYSDWTPLANTKPCDTDFTQTREVETGTSCTGDLTQPAVGTKDCDVDDCTYSDWIPLANTECSGVSFQQTREILTGTNCDGDLTKPSTGTKTTGDCSDDPELTCEEKLGCEIYQKCDPTGKKCVTAGWVFLIGAAFVVLLLFKLVGGL